MDYRDEEITRAVPRGNENTTRHHATKYMIDRAFVEQTVVDGGEGAMSM
jgi:hypothetical protein